MDTWLVLLSAITSAIVLGTLLVALEGRVSLRRTNPRRTNPERCVLKYSGGAKALVIVAGTLLPLMTLALYTTGRLGLEITLSVLCLDMLFVGYCGPEFFRTQIEFDAKYVYAFSAWRRPRVIPWTVIMLCKYSMLKRWHAFDTFGYGSLRISDFLCGSDEFMAQFKQCGDDSIHPLEAQPHG
jgi:hypothetical protein